MLEEFREELVQTGYIHSPLPLHQERSLEAERERKEVVARRIIWDGLPEKSVDIPRVMPVKYGIGIMETVEGAGRGDEPYWSSGNNSTYKEVWLTPAGRWLSIVAELFVDKK